MNVVSNTESHFGEESGSVIEAGLTTIFENYVKSMICFEGINNEIYRKYGITPRGQQFVLFHCHKWIDRVYLIMEPAIGDNGNYLNHHLTTESTWFFNEQKARTYLQVTHYNLQAENKFDCPAFECFLMCDTVIRDQRGTEVYRIRDIDTDGKPFILVLIKTTAEYCVLKFDTTSTVLFTNLNSKKHAELHLKKVRNESKGIFLPVEVDLKELLKIRNETDGLEKLVYPEFRRTNGIIPRAEGFDSKEFTTFFLNNSFEKTQEDAPDFVDFVAECVKRASHGEECYRKYGVTDAGQRFAFIVSKTKYYIVKLVVEPDNRRKLSDAIDEYSCSFRLPKARNRFMIDNWVAQACLSLNDKKNGEILGNWNVINKTAELKIRLSSNVEHLLKRGDHLQRNLKVGVFSPTHHDGIYLGDGKVAHYTTEANTAFLKSKGGSGPGIVDLEEFMKGEEKLTVCIHHPIHAQNNEDIAQNALKLIHNNAWRKKYNLATRNCQLFAELCVYKKFERETVPKQKTWLENLLSIIFKIGNFIKLGACCYIFSTIFFIGILEFLFNPSLLLSVIVIHIVYVVVGGTTILVRYKRSKARKEAKKLHNIEVQTNCEPETAFLNDALPNV